MVSYNTEGDLDLVATTDELRKSGSITDAKLYDKTVRTIQTAALLDIAGSLRVLAHESALAIGGAFDLDTPEPADEPGETLPDVRPEDAPAGSRVRYISAPDLLGTLTGENGVSEGAAWVAVDWDRHDGDVTSRGWVHGLEVVSLPGAVVELPDGTVLGDGVTPPTLAEIRESEVPLVGVATEAEAPALRTDADEDGDEAVGGYELDDEVRQNSVDAEVEAHPYLANTVADPDDLDDDFDGDAHPAAVDALAALKAREKAARAAKPKKGKK